MKTIKKSYQINAPTNKVWQALTDPEEIENWGAGPAKMDEKNGSGFELWGGDIYGTNTQVIENQKLVQDWYAGNWPQPSKVVIELSDKNGQTKITLEHKDVPENEFDEINESWDTHYFGPMKEYLELN